MKGIILAGGSGTRLYPLTLVLSKQLLPVYDKPMIYYPLSTLMMADIRDILIITTPARSGRSSSSLLGDRRSALGIRDLLCRRRRRRTVWRKRSSSGANSSADDRVALVLGDNIFYGHGLPELSRLRPPSRINGATVFGYVVSDPERYGVVEIDAAGRKALSIEEKPEVRHAPTWR